MLQEALWALQCLLSVDGQTVRNHFGLTENQFLGFALLFYHSLPAAAISFKLRLLPDAFSRYGLAGARLERFCAWAV